MVSVEFAETGEEADSFLTYIGTGFQKDVFFVFDRMISEIEFMLCFLRLICISYQW